MFPTAKTGGDVGSADDLAGVGRKAKADRLLSDVLQQHIVTVLGMFLCKLYVQSPQGLFGSSYDLSVK